jgi:hypothetical protein
VCLPLVVRLVPTAVGFWIFRMPIAARDAQVAKKCAWHMSAYRDRRTSDRAATCIDTALRITSSRVSGVGGSTDQ